MAQSLLNGTTQRVDIEEEGLRPTMNRQLLKTIGTKKQVVVLISFSLGLSQHHHGSYRSNKPQA